MIIAPVLPKININIVSISFSDQKIQITFMFFFRHLDDDFRLFFFNFLTIKCHFIQVSIIPMKRAPKNTLESILKSLF